MACVYLPLIRWVRDLLPNTRGANRDRSYSPTFSWGKDIDIEHPPQTRFRDTIGPRNPNREARVVVYQSSRTHPASTLDEDATVLPCSTPEYYTTLPVPVYI